MLKPGGRLAVSDIALKKPLPEDLVASVAAYVGCIAGAITSDDYRRGLEEAAQTPRVNERIDLAYEFEATRWQGDVRLQLNVKDMKVA